MPTVARVARNAETTHWYTKEGLPYFETLKKDGSGMRPVDVRDARRLNLFPSVTNVMKVVNKPQLNDWLTEQAVLAVLTSPRNEGETDDAFVHRVLHEERVQDQESEKARALGSAVHKAIEQALTGQDWERLLEPYVLPVLDWVKQVGAVIWTERVLVGDSYAGMADLLLGNEALGAMMLVDFKTTSKLPKDSYLEHKLQTSAYAAALPRDLEDKRELLTANFYISTSDPGKFVVHSQKDWANTYVNGFEPLLAFWQWANQHTPILKP